VLYLVYWLLLSLQKRTQKKKKKKRCFHCRFLQNKSSSHSIYLVCLWLGEVVKLYHWYKFTLHITNIHCANFKTCVCVMYVKHEKIEYQRIMLWFALLRLFNLQNSKKNIALWCSLAFLTIFFTNYGKSEIIHNVWFQWHKN